MEKDLSQAVYWTRRGAEHGDRDAQFNLAWFYEKGIGVSPDPGEARKWYVLAAAQGHDDAQAKINP